VSANHPTPPTEMRDHWWWRPGWALGRSFYTWHITFANQPGLHELAESYAPLLASLPMLDPVPIQWLHLTMQGVGFTDEIDRDDIDAIVQAAARRLAELRPLEVTLGPPQVDPEGVLLPVRPVEPLDEVRGRVRAAIADVWGTDQVPEAQSWWPHVTLAYANTAGPIEPVADTLTAQPEQRADVEITAVSLIDLNRDNKAYEWVDVATVRLGR
jgi:2'-5' RNA ligase